MIIYICIISQFNKKYNINYKNYLIILFFIPNERGFRGN